MDRAEKKAEAIKRMRFLELHPNAIKEFEDSDLINCSEFLGALYWISDKEKAIVKEFEEEYNAVVYHIIRNSTSIGEMLALLYVSDYEDEWDMDIADIIEGYPFAYVKNLDDDFCSEFGTIGVKKCNGGLVRTE